MQQMANAIMAGEQLMTGLPAAAAAPRGAPPPEGSGFSLMLGEHLWTLSQLNGTGGDSQATGMPVLAMGDGDAAATLDPDAIMQGLLAEIVNLAVDSSGGLEQLSGRLAAKLQQAIDRLAGEQDGSGDAGAEQAAVASELENAAGMPVPDADRLHVTGGAETADAGVVNVTDDAEPAAAAESAALAGKQGITPAMLAPVVRQVLEQLFDELGNGMQAGLLESVISAGSPGAANTAAVASGSTDNTAAATVQRPLIQQPVVQPSLQTDAVPVVNTAQAMLNEQAVSRGVESNTPLLSQAEPALKPSASAQWFNLAAGTAEQTGPRPDSLASLQPVAAVPVPQMAGKLPASPVEPVTEQITELAVHGQDDLRLQVTAQRGSALDPAARLDVVVSDPEGELEEMAVRSGC